MYQIPVILNFNAINIFSGDLGKKKLRFTLMMGM